jgi:tetratricopeptide (TPR) repeat protein
MLKMVIVIGLLIFSQSAASQFSTSTVELDEWPFLPAWCRYTQTENPYTPKETAVSPSPKARELIAMVGMKGWKALHHYCWGLAKLHRSYKIGITEEQRKFLMGSAISEIDYVLRHSPSDFILRPELLTKRGSILLVFGKYAEAENNLKTAIKEQATYWPPYGYLSDVYLKQGRVDDARLILEKGLKIAPNAKGLRNRKAQLK